MKKFLIIFIIVTVLFADEFFEPGSTFGGYGELHWNQTFEKGVDKNTLDFHRFIIYYGYNWTEQWSFKSEVELEHNFVSEGEGELELEQAFVNYHAGKWGLQGGVILPSVGLINEYHEPTLFLSVERPTYSKYIIPTTWFGNGFAFYGKFNNFNWRIAILEDLNGAGIINDGHIRGGRDKGYKSTAFNWTKNLSTSFTGINGLKIGGSITLNNAPTNVEDNENLSPESYVGVQLTEVNAKYDANNIYSVFEYGTIEFKGNEIEEFDDFTSRGYYFDLGYNIGSLLNYGKLMPWFRISQVSKNTNNDPSDYLKLGLTWWPIDNVAFKVEFGTAKTGTEENQSINVGIGYNF